MKKTELNDVLVILTIMLLLVTSIAGILAFNTSKSYVVTNQYGDQVKMWGSGIYAHDSYFKAPIFIGTDLMMFIVVIPMTIIFLLREMKFRSLKTKLQLVSITGVSLYYATSIAFGVTYNYLHLVYIALFGLTLFTTINLIAKIDRKLLNEHSKEVMLGKGLKIFLVLSGISLFVAWLPDIVSSYATGSTLALIEVYTTEITYVLDMGIISPVIFICLYQLKNNITFGKILLPILLKTCALIGLMIICQTVFQTIAGIVLPTPVLITKAGIFVVLSAFAFYFERLFYKDVKI